MSSFDLPVFFDEPSICIEEFLITNTIVAVSLHSTRNMKRFFYNQGKLFQIFFSQEGKELHQTVENFQEKT